MSNPQSRRSFYLHGLALITACLAAIAFVWIVGPLLSPSRAFLKGLKGQCSQEEPCKIYLTDHSGHHPWYFYIWRNDVVTQMEMKWVPIDFQRTIANFDCTKKGPCKIWYTSTLMRAGMTLEHRGIDKTHYTMAIPWLVTPADQFLVIDGSP